MKQLFLFVIYVITFIINSKAQDPHFSQFYANPVYLNPAFVGTADGNRIVLNHRQQWCKPIQYITTAISIDGKFNSIKSGWGLQVLNDNQANGILSQTKISALLAHRIQLSKNKYLGMGLNIGAYQKRFDWTNLIFEDQIDDRHGPINPTNERFGRSKIINADVSVGVLYFSKNLFGGVVANHVNRPAEQFTITSQSKLAIKYTAHFGAIIDMGNPGEKQFISPNVILEKQGSYNYLNLGMYYGVESISFGLYYRINEAIVGLFGLNYNGFKLGYSYDVNISQVACGNNNSHEISLAYLFEFPKSYNKKGRYKGQCPKFYKYLL